MLLYMEFRVFWSSGERSISPSQNCPAFGSMRPFAALALHADFKKNTPKQLVQELHRTNLSLWPVGLNIPAEFTQSSTGNEHVGNT